MLIIAGIYYSVNVLCLPVLAYNSRMLVCKLIILFGSQASKRAGANSDTDVAVLADHILSLEEKSSLAETLAQKLKVSEETIDLIDLRSAPPLLEYQIAQHGKLFEGKQDDFIRFKVLAWKRYQDTAKLRRMREKSLQKYVQGTPD